MASQYRCEVHWPISRGKVIDKAAYNDRTQLFDERTGLSTKDYSKPDRISRGAADILWTGVFVDQRFNPPDWIQDRQKMWTDLVISERRIVNKTAQEIILNLPNDLSLKGMIRMTTDYVRENITRGTGRVAEVNIHDAPKTGDDRNKHVHILFTLRAIGPDGFTEKRLPDLQPEDVTRLRQKWAERGEKELRREGHDLEADRWKESYRNYEAQYLEAEARGDKEYAEHVKGRQPGVHVGPRGTYMGRDGKETPKARDNRLIQERNGSKMAARSLEKGAVRIIGKTADIVSKVLESLISPVLTPEQEQAGEDARREREASAREAQYHRERDAHERGGRDR